MSTPPVPPENEPQPPQYGQNPPQYGQQQPPAYGQGPSPYGQIPPYGQQYGGYQGAPMGTGKPVERPREVNIAFWLIVAAGVLSLIAIPFNIAAARQLSQGQLTTSNGQSISPETFNSMLTGVAVVTAIIIAALYALVAVFVRRGANWARILGTVFAAISLLSLIGSTLPTVLQVLLGVAAIVLLYLRPSNEFFAARKRARLGQY